MLLASVVARVGSAGLSGGVVGRTGVETDCLWTGYYFQTECDQKLTPGSVFQFLFTVGLSIHGRPWAISFSKMIEIGGPSECDQKLTPGSVFQFLFTVSGTTFLCRVGFRNESE